MQYLLLIYGNESAMQKRPKEEMGQMHGAYMAYTEAMKKAGVFVGGNGLQATSSATTVRSPGGKTSVLNGPFAETKEQLGGYSILEVENLDEALAIAADYPLLRVGGHSIEVRPIRELPPRKIE